MQAASLASKLDRAAQTAAANTKEGIRTVTAETVDEVADDAVTAHVDRRGGRWMLGAYAAMTTATIGRQATTRGLTDAVGSRGKLMVEVSGRDYCQEFEGEAVVGTFKSSRLDWGTRPPPSHLEVERLTLRIERQLSP